MTQPKKLQSRYWNQLYTAYKKLISERERWTETRYERLFDIPINKIIQKFPEIKKFHDGELDSIENQAARNPEVAELLKQINTDIRNITRPIYTEQSIDLRKLRATSHYINVLLRRS